MTPVCASCLCREEPSLSDFPKSHDTPPGDNERAADENGKMNLFFENPDGYDLRHDEKTGDIDAHEPAEIELRQIDDEAVGDEKQCADQEACLLALQARSHTCISTHFQ